MAYNQRSFALKHHRGTHGSLLLLRAKKNTTGAQEVVVDGEVRRSPLLPVFIYRNQ